jgi:hypothetical protein
MQYAVEMGSGAMIYTPNFVKTGSGIQTLIGGYSGGKTNSLTAICESIV